MSKNYILVNHSSNFRDESEFLRWVTRLTKTEMDFIVTDRGGVAVDIDGFLKLADSKEPYLTIPSELSYKIVSENGLEVPLVIGITRFRPALYRNFVDMQDEEDIPLYSVEIQDTYLSSFAEFIWDPVKNIFRADTLTGGHAGIIESFLEKDSFLFHLMSISGMNKYIHRAQ